MWIKLARLSALATMSVMCSLGDKSLLTVTPKSRHEDTTGSWVPWMILNDPYRTTLSYVAFFRSSLCSRKVNENRPIWSAASYVILIVGGPFFETQCTVKHRAVSLQQLRFYYVCMHIIRLICKLFMAVIQSIMIYLCTGTKSGSPTWRS